MKNKGLLLAFALAAFCLIFGTVAYAGCPDMIKMDNPAYSTHKKGIVDFSHKKHYTDYKIGCGECHHDAAGKPIEGLKEGDPVQSCIECHKKPAKAKAKKGEKLTAQQKLEYHADAVHQNCIDCHKDFNNKSGTKAAPTSCSKCHPKKK